LKIYPLKIYEKYLLVRKLRESWKNLDMTVEKGLKLLATLCTIRIQVPIPRNTQSSSTVFLNCEKTYNNFSNSPAPKFSQSENQLLPEPNQKKTKKNCGQ
jgi:hypothetical protein